MQICYAYAKRAYIRAKLTKFLACLISPKRAAY